MNPNPEFMRRAIALSLQNMTTNEGGPFGAVVVRAGKIVGEGSNQVTSTNDPTAHAEVVAIRNACKNLGLFTLEGCDLYTSCEPCPMCLSAAYWARVDRIFFGNSRGDAASIQFDDAFIYEEVSKPLEARKIPIQQLLEGEAWKVFEIWKNKADKITY